MYKSKILKINTTPFLRELHNTAFSFAILETQTLPKSWILENFLVLKFSELLTYNVPFFINWKCFTRSLILYLPKMNISDTLVKFIDRDYYIYMELNEFYIPNRKCYQLKNFNHDILIYGFDLNNKKFSTIAYNDKGLFLPQLLDFNDIDKAYKNYNKKYLLKVIPFKLNKKYDFSKINLDRIKNNLKLILNTKKESIGINAYNNVLKHIENVELNYVRIDLRNFRTISEFHKVLLIFNDVFNIPESINQDLLTLHMNANVIFNLAIKYEVTTSRGILIKLKLKLESLIEKTKITLTDIYKFLENNNL